MLDVKALFIVLGGKNETYCMCFFFFFFFLSRGTFALLLRRGLFFTANTDFGSISLLLCILQVRKCAIFKSFLNPWKKSWGRREVSTSYVPDTFHSLSDSPMRQVTVPGLFSR